MVVERVEEDSRRDYVFPPNPTEDGAFLSTLSEPIIKKYCLYLPSFVVTYFTQVEGLSGSEIILKIVSDTCSHFHLSLVTSTLFLDVTFRSPSALL